jgi:Tfp pilus assembly protein PilF
MGNAYLKLQQADLAAQCYAQALQIDPQNSDLYHNLAVAYANQKEYNKAIESYRAALSLSPDNGALHNGLAICYYLNGDKTSARKHALAAQKAGITVQQELLQGK